MLHLYYFESWLYFEEINSHASLIPFWELTWLKFWRNEFSCFTYIILRIIKMKILKKYLHSHASLKSFESWHGDDSNGNLHMLCNWSQSDEYSRGI
jgi:hypothetical protein